MSLCANSYRLCRIFHHSKTIQNRCLSMCTAKRLNIDHSYENNNFTPCVRRALKLSVIHRHQCASHISSTLLISNRQYSQKANNKFTLRNVTFREYIKYLEQEWREMDELRSMGTLRKDKAQRMVVLSKVVEIFEELKVKYEELEELTQMLNDVDMKDDAEKEKTTCLAEIDDLEENLVDIVRQEEKVDDCDIIMEVESGAGGQEAMLFAEEIFKMYENYALYKGWQFTPTDITKQDYGGYRKAAAVISGQGVYGILKYEGGVHKVQRVPKTERKGRIHTSTISVAVYPQPSEIDVVLAPEDIHFEAFRSSGPGGQNAQVTDSAVRIKHIPTGIVAECQTTRSQSKNKQLALAVVRTRIYELELAKQQQEVTSQRKMQMGNKDRSEKMRTYNFPQDRITDVRLGYNLHNIPTFLDGSDRLDNTIQALQEVAKKEHLLYLLEEFENDHMKEKVRK